MLKVILKPAEAIKVKTINSNDDNKGSNPLLKSKVSSINGCPTTPPNIAYAAAIPATIEHTSNKTFNKSIAPFISLPQSKFLAQLIIGIPGIKKNALVIHTI